MISIVNKVHSLSAGNSEEEFKLLENLENSPERSMGWS
jgi:hypothetical protein